MTAYGAVLSLRNTINNVLHCSRFSLVGRSQQIIDVVCKELEPLQKILERLDETSPSRSRKKVNALGGRIKEAIWKFEFSLESLLNQHIPSQCESIPEIISIDLQSLENDANSLIQKLDDMKQEYIYAVENMPQDQPISSFIGFPRTNSKMIGLSDQFQLLKTELTKNQRFKGHTYFIYGMAGVGKTTLAMQIYQDPQIQSQYDCRAWVTVGRVPQPICQISRDILAQLCGITQGDEEIGDSLDERLNDKNCLVVFDDVWEEQMYFSLLSKIQSRRIDVLLIGRHRKMMRSSMESQYWMWFDQNKFLPHPAYSLYAVRFLTKEESMDLLCERVFGDESCPPQLHKSATKIAKLCEGLPLMIVTVAGILSKSETNRNPTYWKDVAEKRNSVFTDAYNQISKVLFSSYEYLPQRLKMPFLFMGVFPQDYDTPPSKIITMLTAEGLWYDRECLRELAFDYSLVLRTLKSVFKSSLEISASDFKTCWLHSSWRYVCRGESSKNRFYHVLNKLIDAEEEDLKGQRGLCLENNILFSIKEFCHSVKVNCAFFTRSLLFYGPYHQYPIPIDVGFKLLREIDALTQRFYTFPLEILSLVQLKYLALTCNGELPPTISKLFNLQVLIIHPHQNVRRCRSPSYVPIQIWDMQELEHIEILGKNLVAPSDAASLKKLLTIVGVNASICTLLELSVRIPIIRKLGIQIELTPYDDHDDLLSCFGCISALGSLETLKFSITNPVVKHDHVFSVTPESLRLPRNLRKLHLSGMGFPWEFMDVIGSLPSLKVLKLRSYAFQGSNWKTNMHSFPSLEFLLIEESDLVQWEPGYLSFMKLKYLSLKHCYKLKEIKGPASVYAEFGRMIIEVELEDCDPLALTCASQFQPTNDVILRVTGTSSFYEKPITFTCERDGADYICGLERLITDGEEEKDYEENATWREDVEVDIGEGDDEDTNKNCEKEKDDEYTHDQEDYNEEIFNQREDDAWSYFFDR